MPMELKEAPLRFEGRTGAADVTFDGPIRNVEALVQGRGVLRSLKVEGTSVHLTARLRQGETCRTSCVLVVADRVRV